MASDAPSERPFPFFSLPLELRNMVYDHLRSPVPAMEKELRASRPYGDILTMTVEILCIQARLVSRGFKKEAESQTRKETTIAVHEPFASPRSDVGIISDQALQAADTVQLMWTLRVPGFCIPKMIIHCTVSILRALPPHCALYLSVDRFEKYIDSKPDKEGRWPKFTTATLDEVIRHPSIASLLVRRKMDYRLSDEEDPGKLLAKWDKKEGWSIRDDEASVPDENEAVND